MSYKTYKTYKSYKSYEVNKMRFGSIYYMILFLALPFIWMWRDRQKPMSIPHPDIVLKLRDEVSGGVRFKVLLPRILRILAIALLILVLMRPQKGFISDTTNKSGVDIMVVFDVSSSMTAEDFQPNRILAAKRVLADFINIRTNDRIGLIVFGSQSYLQCPLTNDKKTLLGFLKDVKIGMAEDGTAIGMAIGNGVKRLKDSSAKTKLILLLTDGDNNAGAIDPETAAKLAANYNINIYAIGIGDPNGSPIPIIDPFGRKGYARDVDGNILLTKMNTEGLKKIAGITNGNYFLASDADKFAEVMERIDQLEKTRFEAKTPFVFEERYMIFTLLAFILLISEFLVSKFYLRAA